MNRSDNNNNNVNNNLVINKINCVMVVAIVIRSY